MKRYQLIERRNKAERAYFERWAVRLCFVFNVALLLFLIVFGLVTHRPRKYWVNELFYVGLLLWIFGSPPLITYLKKKWKRTSRPTMTAPVLGLEDTTHPPRASR